MHDPTAPRRYLTGAIFMGAGLAHFLQPRRYQAIMPPYLPLHNELVAVSGAAEIVLGALLCFRGSTRLAGWGWMALLVAVFPANLHMAWI